MSATTAALAHDLNNHLTVITGYAELVLSRLPADDPNRPFLEEVRRAVDRSVAITDRLLEMNKQEEPS